VNHYTVDDDSIDIQILSRASNRPRIELQVKCTSQDVLEENSLKYPLKMKNYNDLIIECIVPRYLVILVVPKNSDDWLVHSENSLSLKHCAYWYTLENLSLISNTASITIEIPRVNLFNAEALHSIMEKVSISRKR
jgi:hypothetical protein